LAEPDVAVIVAAPSATAVTSPADDTVAAAVFNDDQVTTTPDITVPTASFTAAVSWVVSPNEVKLTVVGDSVIEAATWVTVTDAVALAEPDVAVIVAVPSATEVTTPAEETVTTAVSDELHVTVGLVIVLSFASLTVAVTVAMSLNDEKLTLSGDRVTDIATWATVTDVIAVAEPDVAVIVAIPSATAVTSPADDTVATDELDVAHVTVAPEIVVPPASFTVATSVVVSADDANERLVGDSVTVDATWATVISAVPLIAPEVAVTVAAPSATAVTSPADDTVATKELEVVHVSVAPGMLFPPESFTVATSDAVSPTHESERLVGDSVTVAVAWRTVTDAVVLAEPEVAVIVAEPFATEATSPADDTVATAVSDVAHVTVAPDMVFPTASFTVAVIVAVSPTDAKLRLVGDSVTDAAVWATVTDAIALTEPDWAKMVALPTEIAVTSPLANTVATAVFDELHVTLAPLMVVPFWSLTVADSSEVAPSDSKLRLVTERVIDVATGVGVGVGAVGLLSPPQLPKKNRALNTTVFFMPWFCPAPLRPATQDAQNTVGRCASIVLAWR
jgi:hypothetical protein